MRDLRSAVKVVYFLVAVVVWAAFTGSIYRGEWPLGFLAGLEDFAAKAGAGKADVALGVALYLMYYSSLLGLPYIVIRDVLLHRAPTSHARHATELSVITAAWCALTFVLYHDALFSLVRTMFRSTASEWLSLLWIGGLVVVILVWFGFLRSASEEWFGRR